MNKRLLILTAVQKAEAVRSKAGLPMTSPINVIDFASQFCTIRFKDLSSLEGMYLADPPTIVIGSERPPGRQAYTCAHELGHHLFGHSVRYDEVDGVKEKESEEFLADMFAAFLLMPKSGIKRTLKSKGWSLEQLTPLQAYYLASYYGVGYSTILSHMRYTLDIINYESFQRLNGVKPKQIKAQFSIPPASSLILADQLWADRTIDLAVGDAVIFPHGINVFDAHNNTAGTSEIDEQIKLVATKPGYLRAEDASSDWAIHLRVSRKNYVGLPKYRFLEDEED